MEMIGTVNNAKLHNLGKIQTSKSIKAQNQQIKISNEPDSISVSNTNTKPQEKVSFKEGAGLVAKGFINKLKGMGKAIVQHPAKALLAVGGTALALSALPIIGISTATGAAALALVFAGKAIFSTTKDIIHTVKDNKAGEYDKVRDDLQKVGGDTLDLALSLPFVPKAINQISRFARYGTATVGLNTELISNLKNIKSVKDIPLEFAKADVRVNYEMIGKEMNLSVKPKLEFVDMPAEKGKILGGAYEPTTGTMQYNQNLLTARGKITAKLAKIDPEIILRHELEHFKQFADITRTEGLGIDALENTLTKYYEEIYKSLGKDVSELKDMGLSPETVENMLHGDKSIFNREFYQQVIDSQGTIQAGTQEAAMSGKYAQGLLEKVHPSPESIAEYQEAIKNMPNLFGQPIPLTPIDVIKLQKAQLALYKSNILEKGAYAAQDAYYQANVFMRPDIITTGSNVVGNIPYEEDKKTKTLNDIVFGGHTPTKSHIIKQKTIKTQPQQK